MKLLGRLLVRVSVWLTRISARLGVEAPVVGLLREADRRLADTEKLSALAAEALPVLAQSIDYWQTRAADAECLARPVTPADLERSLRQLRWVALGVDRVDVPETFPKEWSGV